MRLVILMGAKSPRDLALFPSTRFEALMGE